MNRIMILSMTMTLKQNENITLDKIGFHHFPKSIGEYIRLSDIVLVFDENNVKELKQRLSLDSHRTFPLDKLGAYLEYWS